MISLKIKAHPSFYPFWKISVEDTLIGRFQAEVILLYQGCLSKETKEKIIQDEGKEEKVYISFLLFGRLEIRERVMLH